MSIKCCSGLKIPKEKLYDFSTWFHDYCFKIIKKDFEIFSENEVDKKTFEERKQKFIENLHIKNEELAEKLVKLEEFFSIYSFHSINGGALNVNCFFNAVFIPKKSYVLIRPTYPLFKLKNI